MPDHSTFSYPHALTMRREHVTNAPVVPGTAPDDEDASCACPMLSEEHAAVDQHHHWLCAMSKAEREAILDAGIALGDVLEDAIDAYCTLHPSTTYGIVQEALRYVQWCTRQAMHDIDDDEA